jgi:hypothetical protein
MVETKETECEAFYGGSAEERVGAPFLSEKGHCKLGQLSRARRAYRARISASSFHGPVLYLFFPFSASPPPSFTSSTVLRVDPMAEVHGHTKRR